MGLVESTTYRVETIYDMTDKSSRALEDIEKHAKAAAHASTTLSSVLMGIGGAVMGARGIGAAKHALVDFNSEVQNAKISLSTMFEATLGGEWEKAQRNADGVYQEFQKFSTLTPVTTQQIMEFGTGVATATFNAGGSMKDFIKITEQGVIAAKALGKPTQGMTMAISEMLMGSARKMNGDVRLMLGTMHMDTKQWNALDADKRIEKMKAFLDSDAMKNAAQAFGQSWSGVTSTLEDRIQIFFGKVGLPLFKALTHEIGSWNEWLEKNQSKVDAIGRSISSGLVHGFSMVKDAVSWIIDHADTLMTIGKIWAGSKLAGALGGGLGGSIAGFMGAGGGLGKSVTGGGVLGSLGQIAMVGTAAYMATGALMDYTGASKAMLALVDPQRAKYEQLKASMDKLDEAAGAAADKLHGLAGDSTKGSTQYSQMQGLVDNLDQKINVLGDYRAGRISFNDLQKSGLFEQGEIMKYGDVNNKDTYDKYVSQRDTVQKRKEDAAIISDKRVHEAMSVMTVEQRAGIVQEKALEKVMGEMVRALASGNGPLTMKQVLELLLGKDVSNADTAYKQVKPENTTINIQTVEVAAKDPDRWIEDLNGRARKYRQGPRSPRGKPAGTGI